MTFLTREASDIPILLYHSVSPGGSAGFRRWTLPLERFSAHMDMLSAEGYHPLSLSEAHRRVENDKPLPALPVVITFDDGFGDFKASALPTLAAHSFPATLYVTTGYLGETSRWLADVDEAERPMLAPQDLPSIENAGIEVGAHGHSHAMLDLLPSALLRDDIESCRRTLEDLLGHPVESFAYPHGYSSRSVRSAVEQAGFETACAVHDAVSRGLSERLELPRVIIEHDTSDDVLARRLREPSVPSEWKRHSRAAIWRARRRVWRKRHASLAGTLGR